MKLRALYATDAAALMQIQRQCYGEGFVEAQALLVRRLHTSPDTHWGLAQSGELVAYLCAHPAQRGQSTSLHGEFVLPAQPDTLYLHDLAVHPRAHGAGLGPQLVRHAVAHAQHQGWARLALVSVQDTRAFWERQGFEVQAPSNTPYDPLSSYPGQAFYMCRELG